MKELLELIELWDSMDCDADEFYQAWGDRVGEIRIFVDATRIAGVVVRGE